MAVRTEREIDLERVVYDPAYRRSVIERLNRDNEEAAEAQDASTVSEASAAPDTARRSV